MSATGSTTVVRRAATRDCAGIAAIAKAADERFDVRDYQLGDLPVGLEVFVAEDSHGRLAGYLEGTLDSVAEHLVRQGHAPPHAYVYTVAVVPDATRQGVGRALMQAFVKAAVEADLTWIALTPMLDEPEAAAPRIAFFAACGLRPVDPADPCEGMVGDLRQVVARLL